MFTPEEKLKLIRKKHRLSQKEVCRGVCGESNLSQIENGRIKLKREGNGRLLIENINRLLDKKGIADRLDEHWLFESIENQVKKKIDKIIIELYRNNNTKEIEQEVESIFLRNIDSRQGSRIFFVLASYFNQKKDRRKAKEYFLKSLYYSRECRNYNLLSIGILQLLRINYYLNEHSDSRELYTNYFGKFGIPSKEIEGAIIYNYALTYQCLGHYQEAIELYKVVPNYTMKEYFLNGSENNKAFCLQGTGECEEALSIWREMASKASDPMLKLKALCNIVSCARVMGNSIQCKIAIQKARELLGSIQGEKLYQKYYCLGMGYYYIEDRENAIKFFEKELDLGIDLSTPRFYPSKYLECILYLLNLYTKRDEKKIIKLKNIIEELPRELLSLKFVLTVLKVFNGHMFVGETTSLIENLHKKIKEERL